MARGEPGHDRSLRRRDTRPPVHPCRSGACEERDAVRRHHCARLPHAFAAQPRRRRGDARDRRPRHGHQLRLRQNPFHLAGQGGRKNPRPLQAERSERARGERSDVSLRGRGRDRRRGKARARRRVADDGSVAMSEAEALALEEKAEHRYANSNGVKIHYALYGAGPLVVFLHGFPDYWLTWRHQMLALAKSFRSAALDMRGYNLSDKPKGVENYNINRLVDDVAAVIADQGEKSAVVVGHDWGGATAWKIAMRRPGVGAE